MGRRILGVGMAEGRERRMIGGNKPYVARTAEEIRNRGEGSLAARIYAPTPMKTNSDDDPRYDPKLPQVENIYHPPQNDPPPSGVAQIFNWLLHGTLR